MQTLVPWEMAPVVAPEVHRPNADVVSLCPMAEAPVLMEIFERRGGSLGVRYVAWIAWTDAGGEIRSHSGLSSAPRDTLITDSLVEAQRHALAFANAHGLTPVGGWTSRLAFEQAAGSPVS